MEKNAFQITLGHRSNASLFFNRTIPADGIVPLTESDQEGGMDETLRNEANSSEYPIGVLCAKTVDLQVTDIFNAEAGADSVYDIVVEITVETEEE